MGKKKSKHIIPDDYYTNGIFEIARFGNNIICNNTMTPETVSYTHLTLPTIYSV